MDLREELAQALRKAVELKDRLDRAEGTLRGVPHSSVIERTAHELGREVRRKVQALHLEKVVTDAPASAPCPKCQTRCPPRPRERSLLFGEGPVELPELVGDCPCCRRAFFPAA